ncbi:OmpA family protein [Oscillatoria sp. CS-180]|uniref:OmpA family protein n=1 Tax=Oscillatoria sp. CS-180 TaxID=3021720 RepID=UPI00232CF3E1|nr:OmpA family protein [Oscillatoria sp. CS-180]MDB9524902.1 OmpA family protein [Oscillatoria sp. CS-180]
MPSSSNVERLTSVAIMPELPPFNNPPPQTEIGPVGEGLPEGVPTQIEPAIQSPNRWQGIRSLLAWIVRWSLLGVGVGGAWLLGILVAQFLPASEPKPPAQEIVTRRTSRFFQKLGRLPEWWAGDSVDLGTSSVSSRLETAPANPTQPSRPIALSDDQREQVSVELDAIAADVQRLRDRTAAVEQQLGLPDVALSLEERLDNATNRLSPSTEAPAEEAPPTPTLQPALQAAPDPLFQLDAYRVTLPSDVLFTTGEAILQSNAQPLLDNILQDIGRYRDATIVVGSYTDIETDSNTATELSYQQAIAVQRYLSQRLGDDSVHWVAVGYGDSTLGSTGGIQLTRRITIAIVP